MLIILTITQTPNYDIIIFSYPYFVTTCIYLIRSGKFYTDFSHERALWYNISLFRTKETNKKCKAKCMWPETSRCRNNRLRAVNSNRKRSPIDPALQYTTKLRFLPVDQNVACPSRPHLIDILDFALCLPDSKLQQILQWEVVTSFDSHNSSFYLNPLMILHPGSLE